MRDGKDAAGGHIVVKELLARENAHRLRELIARHPAVWVRWQEAFDWAAREMPTPFPLTVYDRSW